MVTVRPPTDVGANEGMGDGAGEGVEFIGPMHWFEQPPTALEDCELAYQVSLKVHFGAGDAACAAIVAAMRAVWEDGRKLSRLQLWLSRIDAARALHPSAPAEAALLILGVNAAVLSGAFDLRQLLPWAAQIEARLDGTDQAHSADLRMLAAAALASLRVMCGELAAAQEQVRDASYLPHGTGSSTMARLCLSAAGAFVLAAGGEPGPVVDELRVLLRSDRLPPWPLHLLLTGLTHLLLAQIATGDRATADQIGHRLRALVIPEQRKFHLAYLHYALGVLELEGGTPATAQVHAQMCQRLAQVCESPTLEAFALLLRAQALADLGQDAQAGDVLGDLQHRASTLGLVALAASAHAERARNFRHIGQLQQAEAASAAMWGSLAPGEMFRPWHRCGPPLQPGAAQADSSAQQVEPGVFEISTLGQFDVHVMGRSLEEAGWHGRRVQQVLMVLIALGGSDIPVDRLCDQLWPEADGARARQNLKVALWRLRKLGCRGGGPAVPPDWLELKHARVSLNPRWCRVDALAFSAATSPLPTSERELWLLQTRYVGDFLPSLEGIPVVDAYRTRLRKRYIALVCAGANLALADAAVADSRWLAALERAAEMPCVTETVYERLMSWHLHFGRETDALATYLAAEHMMTRQFGRSPSEQLQMLRRQVTRRLLVGASSDA